MKSRFILTSMAVAGLAILVAAPAGAGTIPFFFSTGNPDGKIGTASHPSAPGGVLETETADDFVTTLTTTITSATFTGLLPAGAPLSSVSQVEIELYHVFPVDSNPPSGKVPVRMNSPSDHEFAAFESLLGDITIGTTLLSSSFAVANTVVNGINPIPGQFTGGEGGATGEEVLFSITFNTPFILSPDHYFFRPEVALTSGNFLWLSAPKPILAPGTPFAADLQSWTRNSNLAPDWLRIGTDITHQGPFNATFSLTGTQETPEPSSWLLPIAGVPVLVVLRRGRKS